MQALALLFGTFVLLINFAVDIVLGAIDPRSTILDTVRSRGLGRWGRAFRTPVGLVAVLGVGVIVALAMSRPCSGRTTRRGSIFTAASQGASREHPLGTDALGRDIFKRVLVATRLSSSLALLATSIGAALGIVLGALPALVGARLGRLVTGFINLTVALPGLLVAIFVAAIVGVGARGAVLGIARRGRAVLRPPHPDVVVLGDRIRLRRRRAGPRRRADPPAPPPHPAQRRGAAAASRPRSPWARRCSRSPA